MPTHPHVQTAIDRILEAEGGIADVGDGKGLTRFGQTPSWLEDNGFIPPSNAADAAVNYETWMKRTGLATVCECDADLGWRVTDFAVHAGLRPAVLALQKALGAGTDGIIGPKTVGLIKALDAATLALISRRFMAERMRFTGILLGSSATDRRTWARGWLNRLAEQVESLP